MALTPVAVCNQALALLGQAAITDLAGGDVHSRLCAAIYETVRDELLSVREWAFATFWRTLSPLSAAPDNPRFTNQYRRPAGVLRVLEACTDAGETDLEWVPEGDVILTEDLAGSASSGSPALTPALSEVLGVGALANTFTWAVSGSATSITNAIVSFHMRKEIVGGNPLARMYVEINGENLLTDFLIGDHAIEGDVWATPLPLWGWASAGDTDDLQGLYLHMLSCPSDPFIPVGIEWQAIWRFTIGSPRTPGTGLLKVRCLKQVTDPSDWPPYFVAAVVARLAYELAVPVTENMQALAAMERRAAAKLREAAAVDGMQGRASARLSTSLADKRRS